MLGINHKLRDAGSLHGVTPSARKGLWVCWWQEVRVDWLASDTDGLAGDGGTSIGDGVGDGDDDECR